jgi:hypothetical protein
MGYHHIWTNQELPRSHRSIALGVILRSMGRWLPGYSRRNPEIDVSMISNLSHLYRLSAPKGWRRWIQRLGIF